MPRPDIRRSQVLGYLYKETGTVSAGEIIEALGISKETVYQVIKDLDRAGYLETTIKPEDRIRRYRLRDNYREWFRKAQELDIPLPFSEEARRRLLEAVKPQKVTARPEPQPQIVATPVVNQPLEVEAKLGAMGALIPPHRLKRRREKKSRGTT
jgi:DNA-binding MarR family transcriptional regulator